MTDSIADIFSEILSTPLVSTGIMLLGITMLALWLAAAWWAYQDAARRSESTLVAFLAAAWIIVSTPLLLPVALAVYSFARPQVSAADHRAGYLARELGAVVDGPACPGCKVSIDPGWLRCPTCAIWLAAPCRSCGVWSASELEACPYCGSDEHAVPVVERATAPALPVVPGMTIRPGLVVGAALSSGMSEHDGAAVPAGPPLRGRAALNDAGHGTAAAGVSPAAAVPKRDQRVPVASSARPFSYAASRDTSSISS